MALQILKNPALLPDMDNAYYHHASVKVKRNAGLHRLLGLGHGSVSVSDACDPAYPVIQVIPPVWKQGQKNEWNLLQRCYEQILQLAVTFHCDAVTIPLLTENNPDFPAYIDYKVAVDTIRSFLETSCIDVFLLASRQSAFQMPELRKDVETFLSRNYTEWEIPWSSRPFDIQKDPFDTLAPDLPFHAKTRKEKDTQELEISLDEAIQEWSDNQESIFVEPCGYTPASPTDFGDALRQETQEEDIWDENIWDEDILEEEAHEDLPRRRRNAPKKAAFPKAAPATPFPRNAKRVAQSTGSLPNLDQYLHDLDAGFSETLLKLIDKSGRKDSEVYNKANVSRQHFSKIRSNPNYKPSKATAIAFAIALELDMDETNDLIGRAGYTLTRSSKFDVIIMYFIQTRNYNMYDINETLYEFDQNLLGA